DRGITQCRLSAPRKGSKSRAPSGRSTPGSPGFSVGLQPFDAGPYVVIQARSPAVAAVVVGELNLGAVGLQVLRGLLGHAIGSRAIVRRMVQIEGGPLRVGERRQIRGIKDRHGNERARDLLAGQSRRIAGGTSRRPGEREGTLRIDFVLAAN